MCDVMDRAEKIGGDKREVQVREEMAAEMLKDGKPIGEIEKYSKLSKDKSNSLALSLGTAIVAN